MVKFVDLHIYFNMKQYTIYFELFGKKMKTTIEANSEVEAKNKLKEKIIFHKIDEYDPLDFLKNILGFK